MRFIALSVVIDGVLAAFKSKTRGRNEKDKIVVPEEYKDYKIQETATTCMIGITALHETFRRTYNVIVRKEGDTGPEVLYARCSAEAFYPQPDTGRAARPKKAKRGKQKSGDLLKRVWNTVSGGLDGQDCNSRLSRVHRALARRSGKYKLLVDAVGAPLPSAFTSEDQSFFGTSDEEEPRTAYALVKSVCDYLVWEPLLDEDL
ncbi:hypothetical protein FOZ63_004279 [Perkinsus olseni]|uniref:Uncharacterized protein n=1 Tax=Perkinsus olseni TaxID=32597 RepID=A0A7J6QSF8_PEROL|nr:hypothetical protein FOZ62_003877 [Perkinsus olseni]KAF4711213.1 hypothetical protein FOZ63_004279 [Perkinsus olseni]